MAQSLDRHNKTDKKEELVEKLVFVNRVAKTVKRRPHNVFCCFGSCR